MKLIQGYHMYIRLIILLCYFTRRIVQLVVFLFETASVDGKLMCLQNDHVSRGRLADSKLLSDPFNVCTVIEWMETHYSFCTYRYKVKLFVKIRLLRGS